MPRSYPAIYSVTVVPGMGTVPLLTVPDRFWAAAGKTAPQASSTKIVGKRRDATIRVTRHCIDPPNVYLLPPATDYGHNRCGCSSCIIIIRGRAHRRAWAGRGRCSWALRQAGAQPSRFAPGSTPGAILAAPTMPAQSTSWICFGVSPNAFCASAAAMNSSRSPSSTAPVLEVETPVRRSFTIW
jgi:hypothetical protein